MCYCRGMTQTPEQTSHAVHEFLKDHHMGILSTVSKDGKPWGAAINFVVDDKLNFFL